MSRTLHAALAAALLAASASCSGPDDARSSGPPRFPADALTTATSDSGALSVAVRTWPQPPARGSNDVALTVVNTSDGTPADGLTVAVEPFMPSMDHGTSTPTVTPQGGGVYLVTDVYLYMPGTWQLRTTFTGTVTDHAAPILTID